MKLYHAAKSSCSFRVRIALAIKNIVCEFVLLDLIKDEHQKPDYKKINNTSLVPALELEDGRVITQSLSILNYLEENFPGYKLWPKDSYKKSQILSFCLNIGMDIQPLNNLRVLRYLKNQNLDEQTLKDWAIYWMRCGFLGIEQILQSQPGPFCFGEKISMADIFLAPQVFNAERNNMSLSEFPYIKNRYEHLMKQREIAIAHPINYL